jgi:hypothetical protein
MSRNITKIQISYLPNRRMENCFYISPFRFEIVCVLFLLTLNSAITYVPGIENIDSFELHNLNYRSRYASYRHDNEVNQVLINSFKMIWISKA